jgi:hypothetical protein
MKYLMIGRRFGNPKRGSHVVTKRFVKNFLNIEYKETFEAQNLEELNSKYDKLIFRFQVPMHYSTPVNIVTLRNIKHLIYIRSKYNSKLFNSCTTGFNYYLGDTSIKNYIPLITNYPNCKQPDDPAIGFYYRKGIQQDSFRAFLKLVEGFKGKIVVMGNKPKIECIHTYDNQEFFNSITHYIYPPSKKFVDPFPHSLLEAVHAGKQIVIPRIERDFKDGIDDIKEFIQWSEKLDLDSKQDNSKCVLRFENFKKFYDRVLENNFEYSFDRTKYRRMADWYEREVI